MFYWQQFLQVQYCKFPEQYQGIVCYDFLLCAGRYLNCEDSIDVVNCSIAVVAEPVSLNAFLSMILLVK